MSTASPRPLPYGQQSINDDDVKAVVEVLRGDWLTTGPTVSAFEDAIGERTGSPAVSVTSGTAALHTAYAVAGIGRGDEVVTTPMTFIATASTAAMLGAKVLFADVEPDTGNVDPSAVAALTTDRTAAVTGVDYAGHPVEAEKLSAVAREAGALFIEDAAHSIGGSWQGRPVGSLADITTLSFFATKNLTTAEGGAIVSPQAEIIRRARIFRTIGLVRDRALQHTPDEGGWHQEVHDFGLNYRLSDVLCALGISQLRRLEGFKQRRAEIVASYNEAFTELENVATPACRQGADPMWHLYPLRVLDGRRRDLYEHLRGQDILAQVNYMPVYWHPAFEDLGYRKGLCPNAEQFYQEELSLPLFPEMGKTDVDRVIDAVLRFCSSG